MTILNHLNFFRLDLRQISICFVSGYIFFASWTDAFKLSDWLPVYQLFFVGFVLTSLHTTKIKVSKNDCFLFGMMIFLMLSSSLSPNSKTYNYVLAYLYVIYFVYLYFKSAIISIRVDPKILFDANSAGVLFIGAFSCIEFILNISVGFDISEYIYRTKEATATYMVGVRRSYGFSTEPTSLAWYLNTLGPIGIWNIWNWKSRKHIKYLFSFIIVSGWFFTFSASGFAFLIFSILFTQILLGKIFKGLTYKSLIQSILIIFCIYLASPYIINDIAPFLGKISDEIFLIDGGAGVTGRLDSLDLNIDRFLQRPLIGHGLGYTSSLGEDSAINWYLTIMMNGGILPFVFVCIFFINCLHRIYVSKIPGRKYFMIGFIASCLNLSTNSTFYTPYIWILISLHIYWVRTFRLSAHLNKLT